MVRYKPVVVGGDGICDPGRVGIGIDDADCRNVVQTALMQQDIVFQRVQTDDKIGLQSTLGLELLVEATDFFVVFINNLHGTATQNLRTVCDGAGDPAVKQMATSGHLGGLYDGTSLSISGSDEEDETSSLGDGSDDRASTSQM